MTKEVAGQDLLARVVEFVGQDLADVDEIFRRELESHSPFVTDVLGHVTRLQGKRLRPMLMLLSAHATGGVNQDHKVLAAVVEMIHLATLVHDDVLDDANTRRHIATVNSRWSTETSVLFGDYLFTHAFHLASSLESTFACRLIGRATNVVCVGEMTQIHERGNFDLVESAYLRIIESKTAELCAVSCRLGAHFSDATDATCDALDRFGRALGIAFQIADDLLDVLGSETQTGKSLGSDLTKQKLTLPLIRLLDQSDEETAARIREILSRPNEETWNELRPFLERCDAIEYSCARALEFATEAQQNLASLPDSTAKRILIELAEFATSRSF